MKMWKKIVGKHRSTYLNNVRDPAKKLNKSMLRNYLFILFTHATYIVMSWRLWGFPAFYILIILFFLNLFLLFLLLVITSTRHAIKISETESWCKISPCIVYISLYSVLFSIFLLVFFCISRFYNVSEKKKTIKTLVL